MECSKEEALSLLQKCKDENRWVFALVFIEPERPGATEEHQFWAKVGQPLTNDSPIALAGQYCMLEIPIEQGVAFEFGDLREAPAFLHEKYAKIDFALSVRSKRVTVVLYAPTE